MRDEGKRKRSRSSFTSRPSSSIFPKKSLGQNFLTDKRVVERIVSEVQARKDETIVEIGAGHGALTSKLVEGAGHLVAIEYDRNLVPLLQEKFKAYGNFTLIEADALAVDLCAAIAPATNARVVANLPYYISTAILQRLIEQRACLSEMVLMLQREVVERITAPPNTSERGFLSVLIEAYCEAEKLFDVAPTSFKPAPKVWSSVVSLRFREPHGASIEDESLFLQIISASFAQRRKTIFNNLRHAPAELQERFESSGGVEMVLESAGIEKQRRAESLALEEWKNLMRAL
jgi:16S rRNA (adenine1518-N6/adenine1519-N6)-dimethyltransferase